MLKSSLYLNFLYTIVSAFSVYHCTTAVFSYFCWKIAIKEDTNLTSIGAALNWKVNVNTLGIGICKNGGGGTDRERREAGQNRGGRRKTKTGKKGGVIGRENEQNKKAEMPYFRDRVRKVSVLQKSELYKGVSINTNILAHKNAKCGL